MQSFIINSHEVFIHIHQGCFAGTGAIVRLPQCQWSKPDGYGKISRCITTTKHSKAKTVCIYLGIYCIIPVEMSFSVYRPRQQYKLCFCRESWCKYDMDMLSALLVLCKRNPPAKVNLWYFICYSPDAIEMIAAIQMIIYATVRIFNAEKTTLNGTGGLCIYRIRCYWFHKITNWITYWGKLFLYELITSTMDPLIMQNFVHYVQVYITGVNLLNQLWI